MPRSSASRASSSISCVLASRPSRSSPRPRSPTCPRASRSISSASSWDVQRPVEQPVWSRPMSILGTRVLRKEDPKFLTTGGVYAADLHAPLLEGAGWVTYVRSTVAHARISSIDVEDAKSAPGVLGVFTAADLGLSAAPYPLPLLNQAMLRTSLATDKVRFVGEPIVAIVTEHPYQGE